LIFKIHLPSSLKNLVILLQQKYPLPSNGNNICIRGRLHFILDQFVFTVPFRKQLLNVFITFDAFGNPLGLVSDLKESFQTLFFEGDFSGFFTGLGYGVSSSLSKVSSLI
jgi:hypothetical protein